MVLAGLVAILAETVAFRILGRNLQVAVKEVPGGPIVAGIAMLAGTNRQRRRFLEVMVGVTARAVMTATKSLSLKKRLARVELLPKYNPRTSSNWT